ncbi:MAG: hypothetical protein LBN99_06970 [Oscillospiraceae bacterium]|jgi:hypothetical protein|nr:hypothetical protein [Oscillospiraceae bacterium]
MTKKELLTLVIKYTEALTHNAPGEVPVSAECRTTYEGALAPLGSGDIWGLPRRIPYRQTFVDPVTRTACFSGIVTNNIAASAVPDEIKPLVFRPQKWWMYFVRLQADETGKICEIEEIARQETAATMKVTPAMMEPPRILECPIAEEDRSTREEMIRIASLYWDGVQKLVDPNIVPFHPDAFRVEIGTKCADSYDDPNSVRTQYDIPNFYWEVIKRRYPIVDVNTGIVISMVHMLGRRPQEPTGYVTDIFKIENGMIKYVYAFHDWLIDFVDWEGIGPQTTAELDAG